MKQQSKQPTILLKEFITENEFTEIMELQTICRDKDPVNLKLELDYKLHVSKSHKKETGQINEFLYYINNTLVSYLGISSFSGNIGEINGLTHPEWRRKGIFKELFLLAIKECSGRDFTKTLLLSDGNSTSGVAFIKAMGGEYDFSEYRMSLQNISPEAMDDSIRLRIADSHDLREIRKQNNIYFNDNEADDDSELEAVTEDAPNEFTYMVELEGSVIGKIKVEYADQYAFLCGFGIKPDYQGKGYGKAALRKTLQLIGTKGIQHVELDVECRNDNALHLYKSCGFKEKSVMNYYKVKPERA